MRPGPVKSPAPAKTWRMACRLCQESCRHDAKTFRELLLRRAGFLIFHLQVVYDLSYVGDAAGDGFGAGTLVL